MSRRIDEERLLAAALAEFSTHSFAEASVNAIIAKAGISKGSFYYRFATKYDLYLHVLRTGVEKKWAYIRGALAGRPETVQATANDQPEGGPGVPATGRPGEPGKPAKPAKPGPQSPDSVDTEDSRRPPDIFDTFLLQARAGTAFAHEHPEYHRLSIMLSREKGTELYDRVIRDLGQSGSGGLEGTVRDAIRRGEIRADLSEEFVVKTVTQLLMKFDELLFEGETWSLEVANERLAELVEFLRHGLVKL